MEAAAPPSQSGAFIAKLGAWLQLAQLIGLGGTVIGMLHAFDTLKTSGAGDPVKLSGAIGEVLVSAAIGVSLSLIGMILVIIAITACRYRARWMFQFLCVYGLLIIGLNLCLLILGHFTISITAPIGLFFLLFALKKKREFVDASRRHPLPSCYSPNK